MYDCVGGLTARDVKVVEISYPIQAYFVQRKISKARARTELSYTAHTFHSILYEVVNHKGLAAIKTLQTIEYSFIAHDFS